MGGRLLSSVLEVERKFCGLAVSRLTANAGSPPFRSLESFPPRNIHDVYFDHSGLLSAAGVWARKRNGAWEAKIKKGGNFNNSRFEELSSPAEIRKHVSRLTGLRQGEEECFGLQPIAALSTLRRAWLADGEFRIVLDITDFGHTVGEVELQQEMKFEEASASIVQQQVKKLMVEMDGRIEAFMKRYSWAFQPGIPKGKLTAYFERQKKQQN